MPLSDAYPDPTTHPGVTPFLSSLAADGKDNLSKHIFADWLEDQGYDNAARGMRWAAKYNKRPDDDHPSISGWYGPTEPGHRTVAHAEIPRAILYSHPQSDAENMWSHVLNTLSDIPAGPERLASHWGQFLRAAHHSNFNEDNEPVSRYGEGHRRHNTDLFHNKPT